MNNYRDSIETAATQWVADRLKDTAKELTFEESFKAGFLTAVTRLLLDLDGMLQQFNNDKINEN
jgi:hypothetical protein